MKFLSGALPTFGGEGFGWLCYCTLDLELFSVVSGKFLKHQQHWEVHYGHSYSCPNANNLSCRRSWGTEFNRNTLEYLRRMNISALVLLSMEWHSMEYFFFLKRKSVYVFIFFFWKGEGDGQIHHGLIYIFCCNFFQPYDKCQLIVHGWNTLLFNLLFESGAGGGRVHLFSFPGIKLNSSLFFIYLSHFVACKVFL